MMEYETATKENLVQCVGIEATLERVARIAAGICTGQKQVSTASEAAVKKSGIARD
jgi:hypothetical protein